LTHEVGSALRIGIVHARWNTKIIDALLDGTKKALKDAGVKDENVVVQSVPGSYELPYAVKQYTPLSSLTQTKLISCSIGCTQHLKSNPPQPALLAQPPTS
jgi:hypothetical protein